MYIHICVCIYIYIYIYIQTLLRLVCFGSPLRCARFAGPIFGAGELSMQPPALKRSPPEVSQLRVPPLQAQPFQLFRIRVSSERSSQKGRRGLGISAPHELP